MIRSSSCPPWPPEPTSDPTEDRRSYTTRWGTTRVPRSWPRILVGKRPEPRRRNPRQRDYRFRWKATTSPDAPGLLAMAAPLDVPGMRVDEYRRIGSGREVIPMPTNRSPQLPWVKNHGYPCFTYDFEPAGSLSVCHCKEPGSTTRWEWSASIHGEIFASGAELSSRRAACAAEDALRDLWGRLVLERFGAVTPAVIEWSD